jgi:hypothetical protein
VTPEEQELWQKAYAAAFAHEFYRSFALYRDADRTCAATHAEFPAMVADLAVHRLRQWQEREDPRMGIGLDIPVEWL